MSKYFRFLTLRADLAVAMLLMSIIFLMVIPLPTLIVDILIAANMSIAVVLLMVAVYMTSPLEFSAFPSVLLISTLFRLALSVTTTRLILLNGDAGEIVQTFGNFVVGGNMVVGLIIFLIIIFIIWLVLIQIFESDMVYRRTPVWNIIKTTAIISFIGVTTTITLDFLLKTDLFKRSTIGFFGIISFILLLLKRGSMKYFLSSIRQEGFDPKNILIIGSHNRAERIIHEFKEHGEYGLRIRSILDPDTSRIGRVVNDMHVTGDMSNFKETLKDLEIDEVFFAVDLNMIENIHDIFTYLDTIGVSYHMMINESVHSYSDKNLNIRPISSNYYGIPMLSFHAVTASHFKLYIKNGIEKVFAVLLIIFSFPVLFLFGLLVYLTSKGPILFKQERVGLHGRKFHQYKLRSMVSNAEEIKGQFYHLKCSRL